ncbi:MAG: flagellar biosynthetic protein FliO [Oscillospiraceae bacterium]|nr:flagellar biosynthetic protein FliO [Oscillospiraceae bacterium]
METLQSVGTMLLMLLLFAGILFLAWYTTRLIARKSGPALGKNSANLQVVEKLSLGQDKCLLIVRAADKTLLLSAAGERIGLLCEIDPAALQSQGEPPLGANPSFSELFGKLRKRREEKEPDGAQGRDADD